MVNAMDSGSSCPGSIPGCGNVFSGKTVTPTVPLSNQVYKWLPENLMLGLILSGLASHLGRRRNTPSHGVSKELQGWIRL